MVHNKCQQLVLQALFCHTEVDQRRLRGDLRLVVRVGQLGLQAATACTSWHPVLVATFANRYCMHTVVLIWQQASCSMHSLYRFLRLQHS
jgi:hypothetical protein